MLQKFAGPLVGPLFVGARLAEHAKICLCSRNVILSLFFKFFVVCSYQKRSASWASPTTASCTRRASTRRRTRTSCRSSRVNHSRSVARATEPSRSGGGRRSTAGMDTCLRTSSRYHSHCHLLLLSHVSW